MLIHLQVSYTCVLIRKGPGPISKFSFYVSTVLYVLLDLWWGYFLCRDFLLLFSNRVYFLFLVSWDIHLSNRNHGFYGTQCLKIPKEKWGRVLKLQQYTERCCWNSQQWMWSFTISGSREVILVWVLHSVSGACTWRCASKNLEGTSKIWTQFKSPQCFPVNKAVTWLLCIAAHW